MHLSDVSLLERSINMFSGHLFLLTDLAELRSAAPFSIQ